MNVCPIDPLWPGSKRAEAEVHTPRARALCMHVCALLCGPHALRRCGAEMGCSDGPVAPRAHRDGHCTLRTGAASETPPCTTAAPGEAVAQTPAQSWPCSAILMHAAANPAWHKDTGVEAGSIAGTAACPV